jgi:hypothetical protein
MSSRFPLRFTFQANEGNSFLDGGRHAESDVTVSNDGRVDIIIRVENRVALNGACFNSSYFFRDSSGNILDRRDAPQICVDGTLVPFSGPSRREERFSFNLPQAILGRVADCVIVHAPGSRNPGELLQATVSRGVGIFSILFG